MDKSDQTGIIFLYPEGIAAGYARNSVAVGVERSLGIEGIFLR